mmetsp:Transcript_55156/g.154817  ORF Transcript_55156/g.154817 Transcript_55156/m.154817 type:complete len:265 (+) Transcript_55156:270-1064(+)
MCHRCSARGGGRLDQVRGEAAVASAAGTCAELGADRDLRAAAIPAVALQVRAPSRSPTADIGRRADPRATATTGRRKHAAGASASVAAGRLVSGHGAGSATDAAALYGVRMATAADAARGDRAAASNGVVGARSHAVWRTAGVCAAAAEHGSSNDAARHRAAALASTGQPGGVSISRGTIRCFSDAPDRLCADGLEPGAVAGPEQLPGHELRDGRVLTPWCVGAKLGPCDVIHAPFGVLKSLSSCWTPCPRTCPGGDPTTGRRN